MKDVNWRPDSERLHLDSAWNMGPTNDSSLESTQGGGEVAQWWRRNGSMVEERCLNGLEERWLNGSAPDCKSVVLGPNPAPHQHTANSVSPRWVATWDDTVPCAGL
jgi:hypothetical protein